MNRITVVVDQADDVGARADVVLGRRIAGLSRRAARTMALEGRLKVDGRPAPPSTRVRHGSTIELWWPDRTTAATTELEVLAVTRDFVYVAKPRGIHTHRLRPDEHSRLADLVVQAHPECASASTDTREGGAVFRLDRDTTGVVPFARTRAAWLGARAAISSGQAVKLYFALCERPSTWPIGGSLGPWLRAGALVPDLASTAGLEADSDEPAWAITAPLGHGTSRSAVAVRADGVDAETVVWPIAPGTPDSSGILALGVDLRTGHRHQIRAHLAWLGCPVVGDRVYGASHYEPTGATALMLHALCVDLGRGCPGERPVVATPPAAFLAALRATGARWRAPAT